MNNLNLAQAHEADAYETLASIGEVNEADNSSTSSHSAPPRPARRQGASTTDAPAAEQKRASAQQVGTGSFGRSQSMIATGVTPANSKIDALRARQQELLEQVESHVTQGNNLTSPFSTPSIVVANEKPADVSPERLNLHRRTTSLMLYFPRSALCWIPHK